MHACMHENVCVCVCVGLYTACRAPTASLTAAHPPWQAEDKLRTDAMMQREAEVKEGIRQGVNVNAADES